MRKTAAKVLEDLGYHVRVMEQRLCCGRPTYDYGMLDTARALLREILVAMRPESYFFNSCINSGVLSHFNSTASILTGNWQRVDDFGCCLLRVDPEDVGGDGCAHAAVSAPRFFVTN